MYNTEERVSRRGSVTGKIRERGRETVKIMKKQLEEAVREGVLSDGQAENLREYLLEKTRTIRPST